MATLRLFLDLGDLLTKALAVDPTGTARFGFPSVVAHRLLGGRAEGGALLFNGHAELPRMADFDARAHPRTGSYPGADELLARADPTSDARFAGWLAAAYGADRQLLGDHPSEHNIDALVRKALMRAAGDHDTAELAFVIDLGRKATSIERYAAASPRHVAFTARSLTGDRPRHIRLEVRGRVVDAVSCATAALPAELDVHRAHRLVLIDIGYLRTKLACVSRAGCEHQQDLRGLGVAHCVLRILRDGQDQGLVADEIAVVRALERSQTAFEVAGKHFDIGAMYDRARAELCTELAGAVRRVIVEQYAQRGEVCRCAAIVGGGAAVVGARLARALEALELGLDTIWVTQDTRYLLVDGARNHVAAAGRDMGT